MRHSKFLLLPQVYDASPRVAVEAMSLNLPILMNSEIIGGWKWYINEQTGEFFRDDMSDFRSSLAKLMSNLDTYSPRSYVVANYGSNKSGAKLRSFVEEHFADRVILPKRSELLIPSEPIAASGVADTSQDSPETISIKSFVVGTHESQFKDFVQANLSSEGEFNWVHGENGWDQRVADEWVGLTGGPALNVTTYKPFEKDQFGPHAAVHKTLTALPDDWDILFFGSRPISYFDDFNGTKPGASTPSSLRQDICNGMFGKARGPLAPDGSRNISNHDPYWRASYLVHTHAYAVNPRRIEHVLKVLEGKQGHEPIDARFAKAMDSGI
ncbi:hypothetical protein THAOC_23775 [Thalassiosira oceanica]|uniref:Uncharacterized protein n=1 Tax=Thalassiosira oceanica TaxID=159749 RepID=K0S617_THAOC|nr:hypothetical protein THAOC_23775 [Thalassiosira oceanica]|eukprot:EJK56356.1 hypothetical protein THAOC_23775 [Thalassiosira oceanica]